MDLPTNMVAAQRSDKFSHSFRLPMDKSKWPEIKWYFLGHAGASRYLSALEDTWREFAIPEPVVTEAWEETYFWTSIGHLARNYLLNGGSWRVNWEVHYYGRIFKMSNGWYRGHAEDLGPPLARLCNLTGSTLLYYVHISSNFEWFIMKKFCFMHY